MRNVSRRTAVAAAAGLAVAATAAATPAAASTPRADEADEIRAVVDGIDAAVDAKDWERCRAYFTDTVHVDFEALEGGPPARIPADDLIAAWRTNLYADKASFHSRTNHEITTKGSKADVVSKGYAFNRLSRPLGDDLWEVWAVYTHALVRTKAGWKCQAIGIAQVLHARGNELVRTYVP
jgi:hypothetical protein